MPRVVDHDAHRAQLALAAVGVLAEEGYAGASMRRIAAAAGVSAAALYHYFPDKAAVVSHAFEVLRQRDEAAVRASVPAAAPLEARARAVLAFVRENRRGLQDLLRVALDVHRYEPGSRPAVVAAMTHYRAVTGDVLGVPEGAALRTAVAWLVGVLLDDLIMGGGLLDDPDAALRAWLPMAEETRRAGGVAER